MGRQDAKLREPTGTSRPHHPPRAPNQERPVLESSTMTDIASQRQVDRPYQAIINQFIPQASDILPLSVHSSDCSPSSHSSACWSAHLSFYIDYLSVGRVTVSLTSIQHPLLSIALPTHLFASLFIHSSFCIQGVRENISQCYLLAGGPLSMRGVCIFFI